MTQASLDQKLVLRGNALFMFSIAEEPVLVFVMLTDLLPSVLRVLVTFFLLPTASALNLENDLLPSAFWVLVTLCLLPNASLVNFEIDTLPSELRLLVKLCLLPNSSVLDVVVLTDCAEAVSAHAREIARVAAITAARVFITALLSVSPFPESAVTISHSKVVVCDPPHLACCLPHADTAGEFMSTRPRLGLEPVSKRAARVQADQTLVVSLVRVTKFTD